jgi:hypothetical protein
MSKNNIQNSNIGIAGDYASGNTILFNGNNNELLHKELMRLCDLMERLPKDDSQTKEYEKVKEAAVAIKNNDTSTFKQIISGLGKYSLELAKGIGIKLIPELLSFFVK